MESEDYKDWRRGIKQRRLEDFKVESKKGANVLNRSHLTNQRLLNGGGNDAVNTSDLLHGEDVNQNVQRASQSIRRSALSRLNQTMTHQTNNPHDISQNHNEEQEVRSAHNDASSQQRNSKNLNEKLY